MAERMVPVTKREAATCQLETAIKLYFENRDLISAYTLCGAADGILEGIYENEREDILKRQRDQSMTPNSLHFSLEEELERWVKPEHRKKVFQMLKAPQNFFKHADKDHDSSYQFQDWELTGVRITTTVRNFDVVFQETTTAMRVHLILYGMLNPDVFVEGSPGVNALAAVIWWL